MEKITISYHDRIVGTMALYKERFAAFEYDSEWLYNGFSISPFSLPLEKKYLYLSLIRLMGFLEYLLTVCLMDGEDF